MRALFLLIALFFTGYFYSQKWPGLTLYSNGNATSAYLVDTNNVNVKVWSGLSGGTGYSSYLTPGGTLVRSVKENNAVFSGGGSSGRIQKVDYNDNLVWDYIYSSNTFYSHHDHCPMPNGNVLLIAYELKTQSEIIAAGGPSTLTTMWPDHIVEIQPTGATTGSIVWEWHAWDHLVQNVDNSKANYQTSIVDHPELININYDTKKDWMHCNGIDYNPMLDQVILSAHNLHEFYVIDHSTTSAEAAGHTGGNSGKGGDILYRWGNPQVYQATGTKIFNVVHDAHWIPEGHPDAGRMVGFNNQGISPTSSCVDQVIPPVSGYNYTIAAGAAYQPASYSDRLSGIGYTSNEGSAEQLPNGNQLICLAIPGKIYEFTPAGVPIFTISTGAKSSQAHRYSTCYVNNPAPAQPSITVNGNQLTSTSATTYQWYQNGALISGANSQSYTPSGNGIYVVRTTDINGCVYVYSKGTSFVLSQDEKTINPFNVQVIPNPNNGIFKLNIVGPKIISLSVRVFDCLGKLVYEKLNEQNIDLSELNEGLYTIQIQLNNHKPIYSKTIISK
ncbi:MAG: aryl-sulfate sulfotransferase [Sphingobacteriaceae bacterium]|nr:aryl-sulfate sulfotransferase [Sphingobacteriaceae bacterium]